jgi:hypothetical protein
MYRYMHVHTFARARMHACMRRARARARARARESTDTRYTLAAFRSAAAKLNSELAAGAQISGTALSSEKQLASTLAEEVRDQLKALPANSPAKAALEVRM